jgi:DNA-binding GntR family transcriptional regulator
MNELLVPDGLTDIKPIREIIYEHLRQAILNGMIRPGEKLIERDIAAKFNASRTPVRESLRKLESEGFVEYLARKGVVVRGFDIGQIQETFKLRKVLECLAIRNAIANITEAQIIELKQIVERLERAEKVDSELTAKELHEFDDLIVDAAHMPILKGFLQTLKESLQRYSKLNLSKLPRRTDAVREHKEILQAIMDSDADRAEVLVCTHVENSREELLKSMR